jgi:hypothetical protein
MNKIREILFGHEVRQFERKFEELRESFQNQLEALRRETRKSLDDLKIHVQKEAGSLNDRLKAEETARNDSLKHLSVEFKELMEKKLGELDGRIDRSVNDFQAHISDLAKGLSEDIRRKNAETVSHFEKILRQVRADKVDRLALSELLTEMALRLTGDSTRVPATASEDLDDE